MPKLTKTEAALLKELADKAAAGEPAEVFCRWWYGSGPRRGRISKGSRRYAAAHSLVKKGLVSLVSVNRADEIHGIGTAGIKIGQKTP